MTNPTAIETALRALEEVAGLSALHPPVGIRMGEWHRILTGASTAYAQLTALRDGDAAASVTRSEPTEADYHDALNAFYETDGYDRALRAMIRWSWQRAQALPVPAGRKATKLAELVERAMALANAATEGPWTDEDVASQDKWVLAKPRRNGHIGICRVYRNAQTEPAFLAGNAAFIAASRQLIPELCSALNAALSLPVPADRSGEDAIEMGKGIEAARSVAPEHAAMIDDMKDQLLVAFLRRLGELRVPVAEVDATGPYTLSFRVDFEKRDFIFSIGKKQ